MPFDPYRTVVAALDRLTTQVRRVADTMATPVVEPDDAPQTTDDDARHSAYTEAYDAARAFIRTKPHDYMPTTIVERNALIFGAVNAALDAAPEPHAAVLAAERQRDRLAAILRDVLSTYSRVSTPHNDKAIAYTLPPIAPDTFEQWRAALTTQEH